ncbi:MAG TPA: single-stranded DNA-binding protein [Thermomicrobiales bacterium]|jgi:single-strand DNA-binding protein|nr:single-stranded DNA-binding protein [Thermomicrobiales bacterium]
MSLAKVTLIGNLGRDPETRYTPSGALNVQFSIATSRRWRDSSGQDQENTTWFRVTAWGRLAETMVNLSERGALVKGKQVYIEGRLEAREFTGNDGQTRTSLDVTANELQLLGNRADNQDGGQYGGGQQGGYGGGQRQQSPSIDDEGSQDLNDVPF